MMRSGSFERLAQSFTTRLVIRRWQEKSILEQRMPQTTLGTLASLPARSPRRFAWYIQHRKRSGFERRSNLTSRQDAPTVGTPAFIPRVCTSMPASLNWWATGPKALMETTTWRNLDTSDSRTKFASARSAPPMLVPVMRLKIVIGRLQSKGILAGARLLVPRDASQNFRCSDALSERAQPKMTAPPRLCHTPGAGSEHFNTFTGRRGCRSGNALRIYWPALSGAPSARPARYPPFSPCLRLPAETC